MILLVGASGRLGKAVAERLLHGGISFRATCRNLTKTKWLVDRGVEVLRLDVATGTGIADAMVGTTRVISCIHGLLGRSRQSVERVDVRGQAALIDASVEVGVQRFVYVSALGASSHHPAKLWEAKAQTEAYLQAAGLEHVILRPSAFMDLYAHDLIGAAVLRGKTVLLLGAGITPRNLIAVADVAEAAVQALTRADLAGQTLEIGGVDNLSGREVTALYAKLMNSRIKMRTIPPLALRMMASAIGPFHHGIGHLLRLPLLLAGRKDLCLDASATMKRLGIRPVRLAEFAEGKIRDGAPGRHGP